MKSILFFFSLPASKRFSCHSEADHPLVNVALVILPGTERLWTMCCVEADCTSLSCLTAALIYFTNFSETWGERRLYTKTDSFYLSYFSLCHFRSATKPSVWVDLLESSSVEDRGLVDKKMSVSQQCVCCCFLAIKSVLLYSPKNFSEIIDVCIT